MTISQEQAIREAFEALQMAFDDMSEWSQLAKRQREEMPHNSPLCPTSDGISKTAVRKRFVSRAIRLCREALPD